jgi:hypothetical protein
MKNVCNYLIYKHRGKCRRITSNEFTQFSLRRVASRILNDVSLNVNFNEIYNVAMYTSVHRKFTRKQLQFAYSHLELL